MTVCHSNRYEEEQDRVPPHSDKSLTEQAEKVLKLHKTLEKLGVSLRDQLDDISDLCDEQIKHVTKED